MTKLSAAQEEIAEAAIRLERHFDPKKWELFYTDLDKQGRPVDFDVREHSFSVLAERIKVTKAGFLEEHYKAEITLDFSPGSLTVSSHESSEEAAMVRLAARLVVLCVKLGLTSTSP